MRAHRFYVPEDIELKQDFWLHEQRLLSQWRRVLRFSPGQEVVLFDGRETERLYKIEHIDDNEAHLHLVTDLVRKQPEREVYLLWGVIKKDKNEWVVQKGTELGVSHFLPILADRSEKTGINLDRAQKIIIEAAEQCGRSDIPDVREPMHIKTAIEQLAGTVQLFVADQIERPDSGALPAIADKAGVFIGPEGGWSDAEKQLFAEKGITKMGLSSLTYRAETAAVVALGHLLSRPVV
jgi:16S rRNA (uracil1498-N3)-methyltransferase